MEDPTGAPEVLGRLKSLGVDLAIDDFGTGYSSLAYLRGFPVDIVKIDRAFVMNVDGPDSADATLVAAIVAMADALGIAHHRRGRGERDPGRAAARARLRARTGLPLLTSAAGGADPRDDHAPRGACPGAAAARPRRVQRLSPAGAGLHVRPAAAPGEPTASRAPTGLETHALEHDPVHDRSVAPRVAARASSRSIETGTLSGESRYRIGSRPGNGCNPPGNADVERARAPRVEHADVVLTAAHPHGATGARGCSSRSRSTRRSTCRGSRARSPSSPRPTPRSRSHVRPVRASTRRRAAGPTATRCRRAS